MTSPTRIPVKPQVLRWARESAGLDIPTAAHRVGVKPERITAWEAGEAVPTIRQVRTMAASYHRPLATLFMADPIADEKLARLPDFRRAEHHAEVLPSALQRAIMRAYRQRDALVGIAEELDLPPEEVNARFKLDPQMNAEVAADELRRALAMDSIPDAVVSKPDEFLRQLIRAAERLNVTVIQVQRVALPDMRGFSLGDGPCPIVALNGADWPRGKIFSLLHELSHVGFRSNGLCDLEHRSSEEIERKCDLVAAAALMPRQAFLRRAGDLTGSTMTAEVARSLGAAFGASGESATLRMVELGRATWDDYWRLKPAFDSAYQKYKAEERERNAGTDTPIFYQLKTRDLGRRFIRQVLEAHGEEVISSRDAAQLLEVSYDKIPKLAQAAGEDVL